MAKNGSLSESDTRKKLVLAHKALKHQLGEKSLELASLMMAYKKASGQDLAQVSRKNNAFTAISEEVTELTALIEFIESLGLDTEKGRKNDIRIELERRHAGIVKSLERSAEDISGRAIKLQQSCLQAREMGAIVPLGAKVRSRTASDHARLMKDLAILGFIQQFGISSRSSRRSDL